MPAWKYWKVSAFAGFQIIGAILTIIIVIGLVVWAAMTWTKSVLIVLGLAIIISAWYDSAKNAENLEKYGDDKR
jgi:hypothetical protein